MAPFKRLGSYLKPYGPRIALLWIAVIAGAVIGLVPSLATGRIVDEAFVGKNMDILLKLLGIAFVAILANEVINAIVDYASTWISTHVVVDLRDDLYHHLQGMPQSFFSNEKQSDILARMNTDTSKIGSMVNDTISDVVECIVTIVITLIALFTLSWQLALVGLVVLPMLVLPTYQAGKDRLMYAQQTQVKTDEINRSINETLSTNGSLLVKLFTREDDEYARFKQVSEEQTKSFMKEARTGSLFNVVTKTLAKLGPLLIFFAGGLLIIQTLDPDLTVGTVTAMVGFVGKLYDPVIKLLNFHVSFTRSKGVVESFFDYLDRESTITSPENAQKPDMECVSVRFDHVSFGYDELLNVLEDVDFEVPGGKMYALVGVSGVGKSTALNLIPRIYDTGSGSVTIAEVDVRDFDLKHLRQQVGIVTQEPYLFSGTIRDNLLYAKSDATEEEIEEACKQAGIHDFIMRQPNGYDSDVGIQGSKLSGGEKQLLSLARVILKNPKILILDEATSALDSVSEYALQQALETLMVGRTTIVAAHRLATILKADRILVLDGATIAEEGTHEELIAKDGLYRALFETQFNLVAGIGGKHDQFDIQSLSTGYEVKRITIENLQNVERIEKETALKAFDIRHLLKRRKKRDLMRSLRLSAKDMRSLIQSIPVDIKTQDAHFVGFYDSAGNLVAVLDLILGYPSENDAFIAWFMVNSSMQGQGIGSSIISDVRASMAAQGYKHLKLKCPITADESLDFWKNRGFTMDSSEDHALIDMSLDL